MSLHASLTTRMRIVAIDSFDNPNAPMVKPKKNAMVVQRAAAYPNPGPQRPRNQDRRLGTGRTEINGGVQHTQILLLTSGPNPLLQAQGFPVPAPGAAPVVAPWTNDFRPNGTVVGVSPVGALTRYTGYHSRDQTVTARASPQIQILWEHEVRRPTAYANDTSGNVYPDGSIPRRVRLDIRDEFVAPGSSAVAPVYTRRNRRVWCPTGIRRGDVQPGANSHTMTAIGCTCRDMLMRGFIEARYGCKHIIAYNAAQATGNLI